MSWAAPAAVAVGGAVILLWLTSRAGTQDVQVLPYAKWARRVPGKHRRILAALRREDPYLWSAGQTARQIHHRSGVPLASIWPVLHRLEKAGWVDRAEEWDNPTFPRYVYWLTKEGYTGSEQLRKHRRWP